MSGNEWKDSTGNRAEFTVRDVIAAYELAAPRLVPAYEGLSFERVHRPVFDLIPKSNICVLDVGAGSGRDAAWFANGDNNTVFAIEPTRALRNTGRKRHASTNIRWVDDALPGLEKVMRSKLTFDLIWLSGIWMHVPAGARTRAFRKLVSVMRPGGSMMISLRQGPPHPDRPMTPVSAAEVEELARHYGLQTLRSVPSADVGGRPDVSWEVLWLRLPDDGTGALPLLRHVVFRDQKSSTYKLALLRALIRIADGAGGFARLGGDGKLIELPMGLVSLFWVRAFQPLVDRDYPQHPGGNRRLSFVKDGFRGLLKSSPYDLRVGQRFTGRHAESLIRALRDAARCIRGMPATFITYPGSSTPVFPCSAGKRVRLHGEVRIDEPFLWSFGSFFVPVNLWQAMSRYAPWIEPAVLSEWVEIMRGYEKKPASWDEHLTALNWLEPNHDTSDVRNRVAQLRSGGASVHCVWTGTRLKSHVDIDHCFPFAAWPCNDLWNLMPSRPQTNRQKGDRLPAAQALEQARTRIQEWWDLAYLRNPPFAERFSEESRSALPMAVSDKGATTTDSLFEGLMIQQLVLKRDQQLAEWSPNSPHPSPSFVARASGAV